jgi:flagellar hook assembly protein FlgD
MKRKLFLLVVCICMIAANGTSQTNESAKVSKGPIGIYQIPGSSLKVERNIYIKEDSKAEDIIISIAKKTNQFSLSIESIINKGKLTIEIYDSSGKKQGNFTIETQLATEKREEVNGQFQKSWRNLPIGKWKVKIIPSSATANIHLTATLID